MLGSDGMLDTKEGIWYDVDAQVLDEYYKYINVLADNDEMGFGRLLLCGGMKNAVMVDSNLDLSAICHKGDMIYEINADRNIVLCPMQTVEEGSVSVRFIKSKKVTVDLRKHRFGICSLNVQCDKIMFPVTATLAIKEFSVDMQFSMTGKVKSIGRLFVFSTLAQFNSIVKRTVYIEEIPYSTVFINSARPCIKLGGNIGLFNIELVLCCSTSSITVDLCGCRRTYNDGFVLKSGDAKVENVSIVFRNCQEDVHGLPVSIRTDYSQGRFAGYVYRENNDGSLIKVGVI